MIEKKYTILVIEDESSLIEVIVTKLGSNGYETVACESAEAALVYLNKGSIPSAIWLDYYLGDMTGLEFMDKLKVKPEWAKIPVVVVSNSASAEKEKAMLDKGAKRYILKASYRLDDIVSIFDEIVGKHG